MILSDYMITTLGSCIIILIIAIDYMRKFTTDIFQRRLLLLMLCASFTGAVFDYIGITLERIPGEQTRITLGSIWTVYIIARNYTFYLGTVFIDYVAHGDTVRTKKFLKYVIIFLTFYIISLIPNLTLGYYFYVSRDNVYTPGVLFTIQTLVSYLPVFNAIVDIILAPKYNIGKQIPFIIIFILTIAIGTALDIFFGTTNLIWPCITIAILYIYLFVIRTDSKIDSLTGICNRNSFNEYIYNLSANPDEKEHIFILINIDNLRIINDILGFTEGDKALRDITSIIKTSIRNTDFTARLGGDEFIIVMTGGTDIQQIIDRINDKIDAQNKNKTHPYQLYISYGYDTFINHSGWQIQDSLSLISEKMYKYKESRREITSKILTAAKEKNNV